MANKNGDTQERRYGKDDMNLVEFPFATLSARSDKKIMVIEREEKDRSGLPVQKKWEITGHIRHGLPKPSTINLLLVLLELAKEQSNFRDRTVYFTRSEILRRMNVSNDGRNYKRLLTDFEILKSVGITYTNSFWHNKRKSNLTIGTGILGSYQVHDEKGTQQPLFRSYAIFTDEYFESLQLAYVKNLDSHFYFSLEKPVTRKLYRILDKRFYGNDKIFFELKELAFTMIGLSKTYDTAQIKRELNKAHKELKANDYCTHQYEKIKRGIWRVWYYKAVAGAGKEAEAVAGAGKEKDIYERLLDYEIIKSQVEKLKEQQENILSDAVKAGLDFSKQSFEDYLTDKIEMFKYIKKHKEKEIANEAGFLWKAITENYTSALFEKEKKKERTRKEIQRKKATEKTHKAKECKARTDQEQKEREENERIFNTLTNEEKIEVFKMAKEACPYSKRINIPENAGDIEIILDNKILFSHFYFESMKNFIKDRKG